MKNIMKSRLSVVLVFKNSKGDIIVNHHEKFDSYFVLLDILAKQITDWINFDLRKGYSLVSVSHDFFPDD